MQRKKIISKTVIILCCIILAAFFIFPILLLFINSFKSLKEIYISVLQLPKTLNLDNYFSVQRTGLPECHQKFPDHNLYGNGCKRDLLFYGSVGTGTI